MNKRLLLRLGGAGRLPAVTKDSVQLEQILCGDDRRVAGHYVPHATSRMIQFSWRKSRMAVRRESEGQFSYLGCLDKCLHAKQRLPNVRIRSLGQTSQRETIRMGVGLEQMSAGFQMTGQFDGPETFVGAENHDFQMAG
jgi:hypothetical protein